MKSIYKSLIICTLVALISVSTSYSVLAGNRDRSGQAGASHLLIDPWARSNGMANAGIAEIRGLESVYSNVAGLTSLRLIISTPWAVINNGSLTATPTVFDP